MTCISFWPCKIKYKRPRDPGYPGHQTDNIQTYNFFNKIKEHNEFFLSIFYYIILIPFLFWRSWWVLFPKLVIFNQGMVIRLLLTPGFFTRRVLYYTVHVFITSLNKIKFIVHNTYIKKIAYIKFNLYCTCMYHKNWNTLFFFRCSCVAAYQHLAYYSSFWVVSRQKRTQGCHWSNSHYVSGLGDSTKRPIS